MCQDGTSAGGVPQHDHSTKAGTGVQHQPTAVSEAAGTPLGCSRGANSPEASLSGSLELKHKCCAPGVEPEGPGHVGRFEQADYVAVGRGCKNRHCPDCCQSLGVKLRERVREIVRGWKACLLVTLTVDPQLFDGPAGALERVRERRALSRLVRSLLKSGHLKSGRYFAAIEFQKNGHPHWHVLLEADFIPLERVQELWNLNRPEGAGQRVRTREGFGKVYLSKSNFQSNEHAANYVTKYVLKFPQEGYPDWVLDYEGRVPKYSTSRQFWGESQDEEAEKIEAEWCFCSRCRGENVPGVWKPVDLPPESWEAMQGTHEQHRVGILPNGLERREIHFPGEMQPERKRVERRTIRERVGACGSEGAVLLHRVTVNYKQNDDGEEFDKQVISKWYWLGMMQIPFAEFVETRPVKQRRYEITPQEAEELTGDSRPWAEGMWNRARRHEHGQQSNQPVAAGITARAIE